MPVDEPDDFVVARRQLDGRSFNDTLEARKSGHPASMKEALANQTTRGFVYSGKLEFGNGW